jgi:hypothetical protein
VTCTNPNGEYESSGDDLLEDGRDDVVAAFRGGRSREQQRDRRLSALTGRDLLGHDAIWRGRFDVVDGLCTSRRRQRGEIATRQLDCIVDVEVATEREREVGGISEAVAGDAFDVVGGHRVE